MNLHDFFNEGVTGPESNLRSGSYVRDREDSSGEIFIMRGSPEDRRVQITDRNGSGWNISPSRLVAVDNNDPAITRYFGSGVSEGKRKKKSSKSLRGYFFPGYGYYGSGESGEGGAGGGGGGESKNHGMAEGDVVAFPKKHRGDISDMHDCPKCGGDLQGGKYQGHEVKVCMPCKQVYLPPNSGIDQKGNKVDESKEDKIAQLKKDHATAVHWSKNETSPQKREAARQKAEKIKAHLEKQYKQGVAEGKLDEACWKGYHKEGMKTMFGKRYPNCVKNKNESLETYVNRGECPGCGGQMVAEGQLNEKQDACYHKVKSRYKVWPSAYASGALVQCRKKGAANWGDANESITQEEYDQLDENLKKWFSDKWVRFGPDGKIKGDCARGDSSEGKPKCLPQSKAHSLGKKGRASAAARKRREDPNAERSGKAINVNTNKKSNEGVAEGLAQDEAEEDSGWRAELVNEINYNTFEVKVTNARSKESANFIIRPVDMISMGPTLDIETMDVRDLQTGQTESWTKDDPAPDGPIANAIGSLFYDDKQLQKKLWNIVDTHNNKGPDMMPGLEKRRSIGQEVDADAYIDSGEKTQAAMAKMKKGMAEGLFGSQPSPVLPIIGKIDKVVRELTPQNVETGKQIIQSHTRDITRILSPRAKAGVDVIEQDVAEGSNCAMSEEGVMCPVHGLHECSGSMVYEAVGGIELAEILLKGFEEKYPDLVKQIDRKELENTVMDAVEMTGDIDSMSDVDMMIDDIAVEFGFEQEPELASEPMQEPIKENKLYYNVIGTPANQLRSNFGLRKDNRGWYLNEDVSIKRLMTAFRAFGEPSRL